MTSSHGLKILPREGKRVSPFEIRRLGLQDVKIFRDIRLEGLKNHPDAFGASFEEESDQSETQVQGRIESNAIFGGFLKGRIEGVAAVSRSRAAKTAHIAFVWGMYVRPDARGTGLARLLIERAVAEVKQSCRSIRLSVVASNIPAIRLYESVGFKTWATDTEALRVETTYLDEVLMRLDL